MKDELGIEVTPERIEELRQHFEFRSDSAARDVGLILNAQQAEIERLRAALSAAQQPGPAGSTWDEIHAPCKAAVAEIKLGAEARINDLQEVYDRGVKRQEDITAEAMSDMAALRAALVDIREGPCLPICDTMTGAPCDCWTEKIDRILSRDANAAYMAWLQGCDGLLSADDAAAARSEGGWLAYLAGYSERT